jgi:hypothetical protein
VASRDLKRCMTPCFNIYLPAEVGTLSVISLTPRYVFALLYNADHCGETLSLLLVTALST